MEVSVGMPRYNVVDNWLGPDITELDNTEIGVVAFDVMLERVASGDKDTCMFIPVVVG